MSSAERAAVGAPVERHRQVELAGIDAQRGAGDRHPLGVAGQLELGRRGPQLLEDEVAVGEDEDLAVGDPPVHPPRHLQDLVGAEVQPVQHVAAAVHHVGVAGVVDHHGIEAADVERRLPRGGHREQERVLRLALEEGPDDPDRLAAVIERGVEPGPPLAQPPGQLLHLRPGRHEHRDAALLLDDVAEELVVEELLGPLRRAP